MRNLKPCSEQKSIPKIHKQFKTSIKIHKRPTMKIGRNKRGMIGIEAAIILIAFVIVASAFSYMVISMGLASTQRGKETITSSLQEVLSPLIVDGSITIKTESQKVTGIIIPLKVSGVSYVPMGANRTVVTLKIKYADTSKDPVSYPNIYVGVNTTIDPAKTGFTDILDKLKFKYEDINATAQLFLEENNKDDAFDFFEKGYLVIKLDPSLDLTSRCEVYIEIRPEKGAPLTINFIIPANLPTGNHYITVV